MEVTILQVKIVNYWEFQMDQPNNYTLASTWKKFTIFIKTYVGHIRFLER